LSQDGFERLDNALGLLTLNDASVSVQKESSVALGPGFRCGFLGALHMDVFMQRLAQEHGEEVCSLAAFYPLMPNHSSVGGGLRVRGADTVWRWTSR
jgi:translation factor GUF1, mitochondrial